jgi:hypothetical protein
MREEKNVHIVKRMNAELVGMQLVREGTTGRQVEGPAQVGKQDQTLLAVPVRSRPDRKGLALVPKIWAVADAPGAEGRKAGLTKGGAEPAKAGTLLQPEVAFYRKYTEALLRRYLRMSTEAGRVPSFLGRELFRGNVTSYKVRSFEDVVIFCYDVEKCLKVLDSQERELVKRIALQSYTKAEAASMLGISLRWCVVRYEQAIDKLTQELLRLELMNPQKSCQ